MKHHILIIAFFLGIVLGFILFSKPAHTGAVVTCFANNQPCVCHTDTCTCGNETVPLAYCNGRGHSDATIQPER